MTKTPFNKLVLSKQLASTPTYNFFGVTDIKKEFKGSDSENQEGTGSCHLQFHNILKDYRLKYNWAWMTTPYNSTVTKYRVGDSFKDKENRVAVHNRWMEFTLDPEVSPFRDVLVNFEHHKVYDKKENTLDAIVFPTDQAVNTVALFYMFKGLRAHKEGRGYLFEAAVQRGITDPKLLRFYYLLSFYFNPVRSIKENVYSIAGTHDHIAFKHELAIEPLKQKMTCNLHDFPLNGVNYKYYGEFNQGDYCFSLGPILYLDSTQLSQIHKLLKKEEFVNPKSEFHKGYFISVEKQPYTGFPNGVNVQPIHEDVFFNNPDVIIEVLGRNDKHKKLIMEYIGSTPTTVKTTSSKTTSLYEKAA